MLKGHSVPGKVLLTRRSNPPEEQRSPIYGRNFSEDDASMSDRTEMSKEAEADDTSMPNMNATTNKLKPVHSSDENTPKELQRPAMGSRATDSARVIKSTEELSATTIILEKLRELAWSGVPPYMRPNAWRLLLQIRRVPFEIKTST